MHRNMVNIPSTSGKRYVLLPILIPYHKPYSVQGFLFLQPPHPTTRGHAELSKYSSCHCFERKSKYMPTCRKCLKNHDAKEETLSYFKNIFLFFKLQDCQGQSQYIFRRDWQSFQLTRILLKMCIYKDSLSKLFHYNIWQKMTFQ